MKKIIIIIILISTSAVFSQKKNAVVSGVVSMSCKCSDLEIYPYFYYQDPQNAPNSSLFLRFDFHHKGTNKCKPEFVGNITIFRAESITATIPISNLTSFVDTAGQRVFVITQLNLSNSFRPMTVGGNYKISYSINYGTGICPAKSTKTVRFQTSEPIL